MTIAPQNSSDLATSAPPMALETLPKVLFVDDDPIMIRFIAQVLAHPRSKFQPVIAQSAEEATTILKRETIDALVTDLRMPDVDGVTLLKFLAKKYPNMPCGVMTSSSLTGIQVTDQVQQFIKKPFDPNELETAVLELLHTDQQLSGKITGISITNFLQIVESEKRPAS